MVAPVLQDRRQALYDACRAVPDHQRAEIIDGTLYVLPRPAPRHANATTTLGSELHGPFQRGRGGPGGWRILFEPELQLVALEPMSPDLAGWRRERLPALPEAGFFTLAPDWICEVLSRSTESVDRTKKLPIYAAHGVSHVWLIDPIARTLEVHALGDDRRWRDVRVYEGMCACAPSHSPRSSSISPRCGLPEERARARGALRRPHVGRRPASSGRNAEAMSRPPSTRA